MSNELDFDQPRRVRPAPGAPGILVAHLGAAPKPYVYVGRAMKGIPASPLGNPFRPNHEGDAIERFRVWLRDAYRAELAGRATLAQAEAVAELRRLAELFREEGRLTLACWCSPEPCHADVIAEAVIGLVVAAPQTVEVPGVGTCSAHYDRELAEEGLPWRVTKDGQDVRFAATLRQAAQPLGRRAVVMSGLQLQALGFGKCDSCGEVKPGIEHKGICADCRAWARRQPQAA
jgi:hypothetical protein